MELVWDEIALRRIARVPALEEGVRRNEDVDPEGHGEEANPEFEELVEFLQALGSLHGLLVGVENIELDISHGEFGLVHALEERILTQAPEVDSLSPSHPVLRLRAVQRRSLHSVVSVEYVQAEADIFFEG